MNGPVPGHRSDLHAETLNNPPINDLPFEVLSKIFILALPKDEEFIKGTHLFFPPLPNPLSFCAVCSLWRSFALDTPQLWKRVFVCVPLGISGKEARSKAADLVPWIERSAPLKLPLTLFISYGVSTSLSELGPAAPIVRVLNRYATRWETLYLQYAGQWSKLSEHRSELFSFAEWNSLQRIYSLRNHSGLMRDKAAPWGQLTHLKILSHVSYQRAMEMLKGCPKLVWLSIHVESRLASEEPASPFILRDLSSIAIRSKNISAVVGSIFLPTLQDLSIRMSWQTSTDLLSIHHFLTRSDCVLQKLKISALHCQPNDLVHVLTHPSCNSLTSLTISDWSFSEYASADEEVLRRLTFRQDDTLCPRLESLTLERCVQPRAYSALLCMVESRIGSYAGQLADGLLGYLNLQVENVDEVEERLDEIIKRSGIQYNGRQKSPTVYSVWFTRPQVLDAA